MLFHIRATSCNNYARTPIEEENDSESLYHYHFYHYYHYNKCYVRVALVLFYYIKWTMVSLNQTLYSFSHVLPYTIHAIQAEQRTKINVSEKKYNWKLFGVLFNVEI